jgi:hypothetical protein
MFRLQALASRGRLWTPANGSDLPLEQKAAHSNPAGGTASTSTAIEPPVELRRRVLAAVASHSDRRFRWPSTILAAAAAVAIGLAAVGVELALRPANAPSIAAQVFAAPDVRTTSEPIPTGGTATVVYSPEKNVGILVMNNVQPPAPGTVY